jgi:hypothetical protein
MAASASSVVVGGAVVINDATAYKIRREIVSGKFKSGVEIDVVTLDSKRAQYAAWEAARGGVRTRAAKWSRQLTDIAKDVTETKAAATEARDSSNTAAQNSHAVLEILSGKEFVRLPGQTDAEELDTLQLQNRANHNRIRKLKEREDVRKRGVFGETSVAKTKREAKETEAAEKKTAKDTLAAEKKTTADDKKEAAGEKRTKAAEDKKKAAGDKRTKAADEKDRKRQKTDGLQQIDAKQATLSFPETPLTLGPPEEFVSNYVPTMVKFGVPCGAACTAGTCIRTDLCMHRSRAQKDDEKAIHREEVDWYTSKAATAEAELVR